MDDQPPLVFDATDLRGLTEQLLFGVGCPDEAAQITAHVLLEADLRGYSTHGLLRLPNMIGRIQSGMINAEAVPYVVKESDATVLLDADRALGPVGAVNAARMAIRKATPAGRAAVGVINCDHICMAGYYVEEIAKAGQVGILAGVTQPLVHPLGGVERLLGTNPFAVAIPTDHENPLLLDFATSAIALGTVLKSKASGEYLPEGVAVGPNGRPTTDANQAAQGALAPFGEHKGYRLGLILGLLAGPLLGAKVGKELGQAVKEGHYDKGELLIAIDPAAFGDPSLFYAAVTTHIQEIKAVKPSGNEEIRVAGERSFAERARRLLEGVPIEKGAWKQVQTLAEELRISLPQP